MGTRSLTTFIEVYTSHETKRKRTNKIVTMYRQYDGYLDGHGLELAQFLASGELVNGFGLETNTKQFNGMGCLTAQVIAHFKDGVGGFYLQQVNPKNYEEYNYEVIGDFDTKEITLIAKSYDGKVLFKGTPQQFLETNLETIE